MKISVLIPTLNEERYIGVLLSSLANQTFKDFEVIIVDARSDDNTIGVVKAFETQLDIKVVTSKKKDRSYQRNLAAKHSTTEHFLFFDADVWLERKFLEKVVSKIEKGNMFVAASWLKPMSHRLADKIIFLVYNLYVEALKYIKPNAATMFLYVRKTAFEKVKGFDEEAYFFEDFDLVYRLFKKGYKLCVLRDPSLFFSVRRLDKEGRLYYIFNVVRLGYRYNRHGVVRDEDEIDYKFADYN